MNEQENNDLRHNFPDLFESHLKVKLIPTALASNELYRRKWFQNHKNEFVEIEFWDDTNQTVPKGKVLVEAALGGDEMKDVTYWIVDADLFEKERTEFGYVVNCNRDKAQKLK